MSLNPGDEGEMLVHDHTASLVRENLNQYPEEIGCENMNGTHASQDTVQCNFVAILNFVSL